MKLVVVEDSRLARAEMLRMLAAVAGVQVLADAGDLAAAVQAIEQHRPDAALLDIHLPGGSAFDLLDQLDHVPLVVFTTAYDQHAVDAFDRNAVDYLLKPIEPDRLVAALDKVRQRLRQSLSDAFHATPTPSPGGASSAPLARKGAHERVFVRDGERCWFVQLADISGFEACGNYAQAWFNGQRPLLARTLTQLEERLDDAVFFRASRSHLINLAWIADVQPGDNDGLRLTLRDGHKVVVSRRQAKLLKERLSL